MFTIRTHRHLYAQGDATRPPINFWWGRFVKQGLQVAARTFFNDSWQGNMFWQDQMFRQESYRISKGGVRGWGVDCGGCRGVRGIIWELTLGSSETYSYRIA